MLRLLLICSLAWSAAGCRVTAKVVEAPGNDSETLNKAVRDYAVEFLRHNPTVNTYLGGAGLDPRCVTWTGCCAIIRPQRCSRKTNG